MKNQKRQILLLSIKNVSLIIALVKGKLGALVAFSACPLCFSTSTAASLAPVKDAVDPLIVGGNLPRGLVFKTDLM